MNKRNIFFCHLFFLALFACVANATDLDKSGRDKLEGEKLEDVDPGFEVKSVKTRLQEDVYYLDAECDYVLSDDIKEAIENGVKLGIAFETKIYRERWYGDKEYASQKQKYFIKFHTLSRQYLLSNENSGEQINFSSLEKLINKIKIIKDLPLPDKSALPESRPLLVKVRLRVDIESLPLPLRALSYIDGDWSLDSEWSVWSLED